MGNEFCTGVPWPHAISVTALTLFYGSAFTLAAFMPDPLDSGEGSGEHATLLTMHRILRWTSLGMMVLQIVLGAIVSNANIEDFDTRRNVAATHLGLGTALWGVLTTQSVLGSLMAW